MADDPTNKPPSKIGKAPPQFYAAQWKKGQSGNPTGRPKSLLTKVREVVGHDGSQIVERMHRIWNGDEPGFGSRERLEAGKWLADRGWGKEVATTLQVEATQAEASAMVEASTEQLEALLGALHGAHAVGSAVTPETHAITSGNDSENPGPIN